MRKFRCKRLLGAAIIVAWSTLPAITAKAGVLVTQYFGLDNQPPTAPVGYPGDAHDTPINSLAAENSFIAALSNTGVENFESYAANTRPAALAFVGSGVTAMLSGEGNNEYINTNSANFGAFSTDGATATDGKYYLQADGARSDTLTFSTPVAGLGFFITDFADLGDHHNDSVSITLHFNDTNPDQTLSTGSSSNLNSGSVLFFGATSSLTDISSASISMPGGDTRDSTGLDDLIVGMAPNPAPEPSSLALALVAGVCGLVYRVKGR